LHVHYIQIMTYINDAPFFLISIHNDTLSSIFNPYTFMSKSHRELCYFTHQQTIDLITLREVLIDITITEGFFF